VGPIEGDGGYRVIRVEEIRRVVSPYEKVKEEAKNALYEQKLENAYRTWLQALRNDSHIENRL
jgi:parvulin-like peptidyl-prolyl isomerase